MGGESDVDPVVDIEPLGMVVVLLGEERHLVHEAPSLFEVAEGDRGVGCVFALNLGPSGVVIEECCAGGGREFVNHDVELARSPLPTNRGVAVFDGEMARLGPAASSSP